LDRYYAILARSIAALGRDDAEARRSVYAHVRGELDRLIASADPKMPTSDQIAHQSSLEQAIARIEEEYAARGTDVSHQDAAAQAVRPPHTQKSASPERPARKLAFWPGRRKSKTASPNPPQPADAWADDKPDRGSILRYLRSPVAMIAGAAVVAIIAILFGGYLFLSGLNAPSVPNVGTVANQLRKDNAATLFLGAGTDRIKSSRGTSIDSTGGIFDPGAVRISSRIKDTPAQTNAKAARIPLSRKFRKALSDKTLRVVVVARSASDKPSSKFALAIAERGDKTTGWQEFNVDGVFRAYTIEYAFDKRGGRRPTILIWADVGGAGRAIDVNEVSLRVLPN
jgi:hypothetical protein